MLRTTSPSPTHCSVNQISTGQYGCTKIEIVASDWLRHLSPQRHPWRQNHQSDVGGRVLDWPPPRQAYFVTAHHSDATQDCEILQASFWHCKTEAARTQLHVCKRPRRQADCPRTIVWTPPQQCEQFKTPVTESAKLTTGPKKKVHWRAHQRSPGRQKKPSSSGRTTSPPLQSVTALSTSKGRPMQHLAECRQDEWWEKKADKIETYAVTSRKSTALPSHAPCCSCRLMAQLCLRRRAASMQGGGNTSVSCSTDPPLWTPLCSTRSHRSPWSPALTSPNERSSFEGDQTDQLGKIPWDGWDSCRDLQVSQPSGPQSTPLTPHQSGKKMCPKNSGMPHSSPCSRTGAVRLTAATTGASLSCPSLEKSWLGS